MEKMKRGRLFKFRAPTNRSTGPSSVDWSWSGRLVLVQSIGPSPADRPVNMVNGFDFSPFVHFLVS